MKVETGEKPEQESNQNSALVVMDTYQRGWKKSQMTQQERPKWKTGHFHLVSVSTHMQSLSFYLPVLHYVNESFTSSDDSEYFISWTMG